MRQGVLEVVDLQRAQVFVMAGTHGGQVNLAGDVLRVQLGQPFGLLLGALAAGDAQRLVYDKLPLLTGLFAGTKLRGVRSLLVHKAQYVKAG